MSASRTPLFKLPRLFGAAPGRARRFWRRLFALPESGFGLAPAAPAPPPLLDAAPPGSSTEPRAELSLAANGDKMPRPVLRWLGPRANVALRSFDYASDIEAVAAFQRDNYELNFPEFTYSRDFEGSFRMDVRRAALDPNHAIYVLDEVGIGTGIGAGSRVPNRIVGLLWLVVCENGWTNERYGYINNLYLLPEKRGLGLARELMAQSDAFFRTRRIRRVRLTVTASNARAAALYERAGFSTTRWEMEKDID